jgi:hypothetical protein
MEFLYSQNVNRKGNFKDESRINSGMIKDEQRISPTG